MPHGRIIRRGLRGVEVRLATPILGKVIVEFCPHALEQMKIRGIGQRQVILALENPTMTGLKCPAGRHRISRQVSKKQSLDVIYTVTQDRIVVITTFSKG